MIQISGIVLDSNMLEFTGPLRDLQHTILERMAASQVMYSYPSLSQLKFEVKLRSYIVEAAKKLYRSGADFATFEESKCNPRYWTRTEEGGCRLKEGMDPADAINDIFRNGRSYAFECSTAMVVIYYKAVLDSIGRQNFRRLFPALFLFDGIYDEDLRLTWHKEAQYLPGDMQYFKNPDYNPKTPEWQGENAILLEDNRYFGHGIGIKTKEKMIAALNEKRAPGSEVSAYLLDQAARPDFAYLSRFDQAEPERTADQSAIVKRLIIARIGSVTFVTI